MKVGGKPSQMMEMEAEAREPIPENEKIAWLGIIIVILAICIYITVV